MEIPSDQPSTKGQPVCVNEEITHMARDGDTIWHGCTQKEAVRANMRRKVKRLLRKHGYPPDKREEAVVTVIEQAEAVCRDWAEAA